MPNYLHSFSVFSAKLCLALGLVAAVSCSETYVPEPDGDKGNSDKTVYMAAAIKFPKHSLTRLTRAGTVNSDNDDRLNTLRVIVARSSDGSVVYNARQNVAVAISQPTGPTTVWNDPFIIPPGTYDFYFIGNEDSWNLAGPLAGLGNAADLFTNPTFTQLPYTPAFKPTPTKPIVYTQCYKSVVVPDKTATWGIPTNPYHFQAEGDEEVELIRTLAKVELKLDHVVHVDEVTPGVFKPTQIKYKRVANVGNLRLTNVPKYFSLFGNPYLGLNSSFYPTAHDYSVQWYTGAGDLQDNYVFEANPHTQVDNSEVVYTQASGSGATERLFDYKNTFYVPEYLRQLTASEPTVNPSYAAGSMSFEIQDNLNRPYYKFSIWQTAFDENKKAVGTGANDYFVLPNHANYSKYSVVRNNFYKIEAEEGQQLMLHYKLTDWCTSYNARIFAGPGFQVVVNDPVFTNGTSKISVVSTEAQLPADHLIELRPVGGATFAHTATSKGGMNGNNFEMGNHAGDKAFQAEGQLDLSLTPLSTPGANVSVFDIYYNGKKLYTVKSE